MPAETKANQPLPHCITFLTCMGILEHHLSHTTQLLNPHFHLPLLQFPAKVPISLFLEMTGGHGSYLPRLCFMDMSEEVVWQGRFTAPIQSRNPLFPDTHLFHDLILDVPHAGRYRLVLFLNDQELVQRSLWFGPSEIFLQG